VQHCKIFYCVTLLATAWTPLSLLQCLHLFCFLFSSNDHFNFLVCRIRKPSLLFQSLLSLNNHSDEQVKTLKKILGKCFNPCFPQTTTSTQARTFTRLKLHYCFNPCFPQATTSTPNWYGLQEFKPIGFNPCFPQTTTSTLRDTEN